MLARARVEEVLGFGGGGGGRRGGGGGGGGGARGGQGGYDVVALALALTAGEAPVREEEQEEEEEGEGEEKEKQRRGGARPRSAKRRAQTEGPADPLALRNALDDALQILGTLEGETQERLDSLQARALSAEEDLSERLARHETSLHSIAQSISALESRFQNVVRSASRIGGQLHSAETQRARLQEAEELRSYFVAFESFPTEQIEMANSLQEAMPQFLVDKPLGESAAILHKLARISGEMSLKEMETARENIRRLSARMESDLLMLFEDAANEQVPVSMTTHQQPQHTPHQASRSGTQTVANVKRMKELADILMLFNNGAHLQQHFIFNIVKTRVSDRLVDTAVPGTGASSDAGARMGPGAADSASGAHDQLSELFGSITRLCDEQFAIIRQVFPPQTALHLVRSLVQRILNDPAFRVQAKVRSVLIPEKPNPPLGLSDYLDALFTVHEKTQVLLEMMLSACVAVTSEGEGIVAGVSLTGRPSESERGSFVDHGGPGAGVSSLATGDIQALRTYLEDQVMEIFRTYGRDYFDKELTLLRMRFVDTLRRHLGQTVFSTAVLQVEQQVQQQHHSAAGAHGRLHGGGGAGAAAGVGGGGAGPVSGRSATNKAMAAAVLRPEQIPSFDPLLRGLLGGAFTRDVLRVARDAVSRCIRMEKSHEELPSHLSSMYAALMRFLVEGIYIPCMEAGLLLMQRAIDVGDPAPADFCRLFACLHREIAQLQSFFQDVISPELRRKPNDLTACKELRRKLFMRLDSLATDSIRQWMSFLTLSADRALSSHFMKSDYNRKLADPQSLESTAAFRALAEVLSSQISAATAHMTNVDMTELWTAFSRHLYGTIIAHIKRARVSEHGSFVLARDIEELQRATTQLNSRAMDAIVVQLKELIFVFMTPADNVEDVVRDLLVRLEDSNDVLDIVKRRSDYRVHGVRSAWAQRLFGSEEVQNAMRMEDEHGRLSAADITSVWRAPISHGRQGRSRNHGLVTAAARRNSRTPGGADLVPGSAAGDHRGSDGSGGGRSSSAGDSKFLSRAMRMFSRKG